MDRFLGTENKKELAKVSVFITIIFVAHTLNSYAYVNNYFGLKYNWKLQQILRILIWTVPVFLYLIHEKINPLSYLKLNKNIIKGILWGAVIGGSIFLLNIFASYLIIGKVLFKERISEELWIKAILLVGLSEEVLFRGFILQKIAKVFGFWVGNLVSAFLFLLIHILGWVMTNNIQSPMNMISLVLLGLLFGFALKKSNSLWSSMVAHSINNYTSLAIFL